MTPLTMDMIMASARHLQILYLAPHLVCTTRWYPVRCPADIGQNKEWLRRLLLQKDLVAERGEDTDENVHRRRGTVAVPLPARLGDQLRGPGVNVRERGRNGMIGGTNPVDNSGMIMVVGPGGPGILAGETMITLTYNLPLFLQVLLEQHLPQLLVLLRREDQTANRSQTVRKGRCTMVGKIIRHNIILYRSS